VRSRAWATLMARADARVREFLSLPPPRLPCARYTGERYSSYRAVIVLRDDRMRRLRFVAVYARLCTVSVIVAFSDVARS